MLVPSRQAASNSVSYGYIATSPTFAEWEDRWRMECLRSMITFDPTTIAYRSTGSVPVPLRKGSNPAQNTYNKNNKGDQKLHVAGVNMTIK